MLTRPRKIGFAVLVIVLVLPQAVTNAQRRNDARARIVGAWRILAYEVEFQDGTERRVPLGSHPNGYLVFGSDGRMMAYFEADGRMAPKTDQQSAAAYRTLIAYTGRYRVQGNKWITKVDGAWNVVWSGTEQERSFDLNGDRLSVVSQWNPNPLYDGKLTRGHLAFEREK